MEPLRILLGNNTLSALAGSETWTATLAAELKKQGHKVECFSPELGIIAEDLRSKDIKSYDNISTSGVEPFSFILKEKPFLNYDVIIANHFNIVEFLRSQFPKTPIISTIHGIVHFMKNTQTGEEAMAPEHPALTSGVNQFISVSEEVQEKLKKEYGLDSVLIRNFIDVEKFKPRRKYRKPKEILFSSNYNTADDEEVKVLREVAKHYKCRLAVVGMNFNQVEDPVPHIKSADIVIGMGRTVLEGISAGKLGIVHGRWGTGGVVSESNFEELRKCNFSGRNSGGKYFTAQDFIDEINKNYFKSTLNWGRNYILRDHNAKTATEIFVNLAIDLLGRNIVAATDPELRPYRRAKDVKNT